MSRLRKPRLPFWTNANPLSALTTTAPRWTNGKPADLTETTRILTIKLPLRKGLAGREKRTHDAVEISCASFQTLPVRDLVLGIVAHRRRWRVRTRSWFKQKGPGASRSYLGREPGGPRYPRCIGSQAGTLRGSNP